MAVTKTTTFFPLSTTPTEIAASNADRRAIIIRVVLGEVWLGPDNTVEPEGGFVLFEGGDDFTDSIPCTDAWYAVIRSGKTGSVCVMDVSDV